MKKLQNFAFCDFIPVLIYKSTFFLCINEVLGYRFQEEESILYDTLLNITAQKCPYTYIFQGKICPFWFASRNSFCVLLRHKAAHSMKVGASCGTISEILLLKNGLSPIVFTKKWKKFYIWVSLIQHSIVICQCNFCVLLRHLSTNFVKLEDLVWLLKRPSLLKLVL